MTSAFSVKGFVTLDIINIETGEVSRIEDQNLIVATGYQYIADKISGFGTPGEIDKIHFGTNGSAAAAGDTLAKMNNVFTKSLDNVSRSSQPAYAGIVYNFSLGPNEANGLNIREMALSFPDPIAPTTKLFSRFVRASIIKTTAIRIEGSWAIAVTPS